MQELGTIRFTPQPQPSTTAPSWREQWSLLGKLECTALTRSEILTAYGQTEASLKELTGIIAAADAKRIASQCRAIPKQQDDESESDQQLD